jgi:hypothetical protein
MPRGGARARSGPAPDPNALRRLRKDDAGWTTLPSEGREDVAPEWPLVEPSTRELELWESWWAKPQAVIWERSCSTDYVAFTVRMFAEAEQPKARTEDRKSLNQMMANLYLTPDSLARARLKIAVDETATKRDEKAEPVRRASTRDRFTVVNGGA